jgi:methionyl-tRNA formyltransferase
MISAATPDFAVPSLDRQLAAGYQVVAVYTQPDRPAGRGRQLRISTVKQRAMSDNLPVRQPHSLRDAQVQAELAALKPDLLIVAAYCLILPAAVLAIPRSGCINVHASLLPRWRGAAPIQRALLAGDCETGISIMQMEAGLDSGPVFGRSNCTITATMTGGELHDQLASLGAQTLLDLLPAIISGAVTAQPQDQERITYADKLIKNEAELDWYLPAVDLQRKVLAFNPWPVAQTHIAGKPLRIWRAQALADVHDGQPGQVLQHDKTGIYVASGSGRLCLTEIQLPGKKIVSAADFLNAHSLQDAVLGNTHTGDLASDPDQSS